MVRKNANIMLVNVGNFFVSKPVSADCFLASRTQSFQVVDACGSTCFKLKTQNVVPETATWQLF